VVEPGYLSRYINWAEEPGFDSMQGQEIFSPLHVVHTGSTAHTAFYPMGTGGSFPGGRAAGALS
jgi:hypothetical protein